MSIPSAVRLESMGTSPKCSSVRWKAMVEKSGFRMFRSELVQFDLSNNQDERKFFDFEFSKVQRLVTFAFEGKVYPLDWEC